MVVVTWMMALQEVRLSDVFDWLLWDGPPAVYCTSAALSYASAVC